MQADGKRQQDYEQARAQMMQYVGKPLSHEMIKHLHGLVIGAKTCNYATTSKKITDANQILRYISPGFPAYSVDKEMAELLGWYNDSGSLTGVLAAARLHWGFVKIHPFNNGNGRIARLLFLFELLNCGYVDDECRGLEKYFEFAGKRPYYGALDDGSISYKGLESFNTDGEKWLAYIGKAF